jgi:hypothetical protein
MAASAFVSDASRKRIEADMIAGPAWTLDGRTFAAATGAARSGAQFVAGGLILGPASR